MNHLSGVRESLPDQRFEFLNLTELNVAFRLPELGDDEFCEPPSPFSQVGHRLGYREPVFSLTLDATRRPSRSSSRKLWARFRKPSIAARWIANSSTPGTLRHASVVDHGTQ